VICITGYQAAEELDDSPRIAKRREAAKRRHTPNHADPPALARKNIENAVKAICYNSDRPLHSRSVPGTRPGPRPSSFLSRIMILAVKQRRSRCVCKEFTCP